MDNELKKKVEEARKKMTEWEFKKWLEYQFGEGQWNEEDK